MAPELQVLLSRCSSQRFITVVHSHRSNALPGWISATPGTVAVWRAAPLLFLPTPAHASFTGMSQPRFQNGVMSTWEGLLHPPNPLALYVCLPLSWSLFFRNRRSIFWSLQPVSTSLPSPPFLTEPQGKQWPSRSSTLPSSQKLITCSSFQQPPCPAPFVDEHRGRYQTAVRCVLASNSSSVWVQCSCWGGRKPYLGLDKCP